MENKQYQEDYKKFISEYKKGVTDAEDIGIVVARMAQYFYEVNSLLGERWKKMVAVSAEVVGRNDDTTGKPISVSKAEIIINSLPEAASLNDAKIDRENIEQIINALKSLQRGALNEYAHMSGV